MKIVKSGGSGKSDAIRPYLRSDIKPRSKGPVVTPQAEDTLTPKSMIKADLLTRRIDPDSVSFFDNSSKGLVPVRHLDDVMRLQSLEPMHQRKVFDLWKEQSEKLLPLVLAKCECPVHLKNVGRDVLDHPLFIDGALLFALIMNRPTYDDRSFDEARKKIITRFASLPFSFIAIHPVTKEVSIIGHKLQLSALKGTGSSAVNAVFKTQNFGSQIETSGLYEMIVAAMYYVGVNVKQDVQYAKLLFEQEASKDAAFAQANALMLCLGPNNLSVIRALLKLGADPHQEDEQGDTFLERLGEGHIRAGIQDLIDLESSETSEVL